MTTEQFNEKYKDYLERGHYGLALDDKSVDYLDNEFQELIKIPGFKYLQIKSKFNSYRFYASNVEESKCREIETKLKQIYDSSEKTI